MSKMKEQSYLLRGSGFVGNHLRSLLPEHYNLPRDWDSVPQSDHIVYLASYGNYHDQTGMGEIYKANLTEPTRLLNQLFDFKSFIYISTSSVLLPYQTFYSASKKAMEDVCQIWAREHNKPVIVVRPSSITGVGEQVNHLIPTLIRSCLHGEEMPFVGEPTHDFIDIEDFCRGILFVCDHAQEYAGQVINLSSGNIYTNSEVKDLVETATGKKANTRPVESMRKYDTRWWEVKPTIPSLFTKPLSKSIIEIIEMVNHG